MVTKVVGEVNGQSIIFKYNEWGSWTATVPFNEDGEWIASLYAYDDAGNMAFTTEVLFAITGHELTIKLLDEGFIGELEDRGFIGSLIECEKKHKNGGI